MLLKSPCVRTFIKCRFQLQCLFYHQKHSEPKYLLNILLQTSFEEHAFCDMQSRSPERIWEPSYPFPWLEGSGMRTASEEACSLGPGWQQLPLLCVTVRCGESPVQVVCTTLPTPCHAHFLLLRARALTPSWSLHRKQQGSAMLGSVVQLKRSGFILVAPYYLWHKKGNSWLKQLSRVSERTLSL